MDTVMWLLGRRLRLRVRGASMTPVLRDGDTVLVDSTAYRRDGPRAGDIVLASHPFQGGVRVIKRVSHLAPSGEVFLVGDNPRESTDSRSFGPLPTERVIGQVVGRLY